MTPDQQLRVVKQVEQLIGAARAQAEAGNDASLQLWLARRALREFGRRRAKRVCAAAE
jgi:hypothetical protein